jgi:creatinine amidohydrolase
MSKKKMLEEMTWQEIDELRKKDTTIVLPAGSVEVEGPHMPLAVDSIVALEIARRVAERVQEAVVGPLFNVTFSDWHMGFPGTLTLSMPTLMQVVKEVCDSFAKHGFKRIFFVNSHVGNEPAIWTVGNEMALTSQARIGMISIWPLTTDFAKEIPEFKENKFMHAGEIMTSIVLAIRPDLVNMKRAIKEYTKARIETFDQVLSSKVKFKDRVVTVYHRSDEVTESGVMGDPTEATKEKGEKILGRMVDYISDFVEEFNKMPVG